MAVLAVYIAAKDVFTRPSLLTRRSTLQVDMSYGWQSIQKMTGSYCRINNYDLKQLYTIVKKFYC